MKEVKITIPDDCELVKDGNSYVVKEKEKIPPRSWEEFCKNYPIKEVEAYISTGCDIRMSGSIRGRDSTVDKNSCASKEEAEAFLALMQLRQLRKAWVGEYKQVSREETAVIKYRLSTGLYVRYSEDCIYDSHCLSFPDKEMAEDFLSCFRDLCETAKILL